MPEYVDRNALGADRPLPTLYWTGDTEMNCLRDAAGQTLQYGYAHHNQRMAMPLRNLSRKSAADVRAIRRHADDQRGQLS